MEKETISETWRRFAEAFLAAHEAWKTHSERMILATRRELDEVPPEFAKHLAQPFHKAPFHKMLQDLVVYCRTGGGFEILTPPPKPKPKIEEKEK